MTLSGQCADWLFTISDCCRNAAITTISGAAGTGLFLEARLNNLNSDNSSPQFTHDPILFTCIGQDIIFNNGLVDQDGDSLVYSLVAQKSDANTSLIYNTGYSAQQPLSSNPLITFDAYTGNFFMHPTNLEVGIIVYQIDEYRAGTLIGRVMRDVLMYTTTCSNQVPGLTGLNGTSQMAAYILPGTSSCFHIFSYDADVNDTLSMTWNNGIPQAFFSAMGSPYPTGNFCWTPTLNDVRIQPYTFIVTVRDSKCPTNGAAVYSYSIIVTLDSSLVTPVNPHGYFSGNVFYDLNSDGLKDTSEFNFPGQRINVAPDGLSVFTNQIGDYLFYSMANNSHQINLVTHPDWIITSDSTSYTVTDDSLNQVGFDFGINASTIYNQLEINLAAGFPRCLDTVIYWINYENTGTNLSDGRVLLILDQATTFIGSNPSPDLFSGDTLYYDFLNLMPFSQNHIALQLLMPAPGDTIFLNGVIEYDSAATSYTSDTQIYQQVINCSYDPNDKTVLPEGLLAEHRTFFRDTLLYTIRFQNTGTDTAFTVFIQDFIDQGLDLNTFHVTGSSHAMNTTIYPNRMVEFRFENILLPDSGTNELESHGFVQFEILPRTNLTLPVAVTNNASIFFDSNMPVVTNTVSNTLVSELILEIMNPLQSSGLSMVVPNPFQEHAEILLSKVFFDSESEMRVMNAMGALVLTKTVSGNSFKLSRGNLAEGIYFYEVINNNGNRAVGKFAIN